MVAPVLVPALALVCWTHVMWVWLYATRLPAMQRAKIDPAKMKDKSELNVLPREARNVADNYNHLHEQPVLFYALVFYSHSAGTADAFSVALAWAYVAFRVAHSIHQATVNFIPVRFTLFLGASVCLFIFAGREVRALF